MGPIFPAQAGIVLAAVVGTRLAFTQVLAGHPAPPARWRRR